jgi:hypothetical protein
MSDLLAIMAIYRESQRTGPDGYGSVGLETSVRMPDGDDIHYGIHSIRPLEEIRFAAEQKTDAYLSFELRGEVTGPDVLKGYRVVANFNEDGSTDSPDYQKIQINLKVGGIIKTPNRLGTGLMLDRDSFSFDIVVPPYVVKDTLDQLYRSSGDRKRVWFSITNLRQRDPNSTDVYFSSWDIAYDLVGISL